jgi:hypothetical protein
MRKLFLAVVVCFIVTGCGGGSSGGYSPTILSQAPLTPTPTAGQTSIPTKAYVDNPSPSIGGEIFNTGAIIFSSGVLPVPVGTSIPLNWSVQYASIEDFYSFDIYISNTLSLFTNPNSFSNPIRDIAELGAYLIYKTSGGTYGGIINTSGEESGYHSGEIIITRKTTDTFTVPNLGDMVTTGIDYTKPVYIVAKACIVDKDTLGYQVCANIVGGVYSGGGGTSSSFVPVQIQ